MIYRWVIVLGLWSSAVMAAEPPVTTLAISADGQSVIAGSQSGVAVLDWPNLKPVRKIATEIANVLDVKFSPDGTTLALAGGRPGQAGRVELVRWPTGERILKFDIEKDIVNSFAWSNDGQLMAIACADGQARLVNAKTGKVVSTMVGHSKAVSGVDFLPNGDLVTSGLDESLRVWNGETGQLIRTMSNHTRPVVAVAVTSMKSGPAVAVSISMDRTIRFWHPETGRLLRFVRLPSEPRCVAWIENGPFAAVACTDGQLRIVDSVTAEIRTEVAALNGVAYSVATHGHQKIIAGGEAGRIALVKWKQQ